MHSLLIKYHRYLTAVAEQAQDIAGRQIEFPVQVLPWMGPAAVGLVVLSILDPHRRLDDAQSLCVFLPFAALSFAGVCYVALVFASVGVRQSYERAEARERSEHSPWGSGVQAGQDETPSSLKTWLKVGIPAVFILVSIAGYLAYRCFSAHPEVR